MIVVDFVETVRQQMQLLYYRGEYIVAIKMCLGRLWSFTFSLGARYDLKEKKATGANFSMVPINIGLRKSFQVCSIQQRPAPNNGFLLHSLKTLLWLPRMRVRLNIQKSILSGATKFVSIRSSQGNLSLIEITRDSDSIIFPIIL